MTPKDSARPTLIDTNYAVKKTLLDRLRCPKCLGVVAESGNNLDCQKCRASYRVDRGIPVMVDAKEPIESALDYRKHYVLDSELYDYFEPRFGATAHSERRLREFIFSRLGDQPSLLDVGCGSAWVAAKVHATSTFLCSLDISAINPRKALDLYPGENHVGVAADSYALPFADNTFDAVVAAEIIEHVPDPQAFVTELLRVVRGGGKLVISTPYKERLVTELCIHCNQQTPHNAHLHSFDENKLLSMFDGLPVRSKQFFTFNNKLLAFARTHPVLKYLPFGAWKAVDALANALYARPMNIVIEIRKSL